MGVVYGYWDTLASTGGTDNDTLPANLNLSNADWDVVLAAFTDGSSFLDSMVGASALDDLWDAYSAKTDQVETARISVTGTMAGLRARGGWGDDDFTLTSTGAWIDARQGDDVLMMMGSADDTLIGGKGDDSLYGGGGADLMQGGRGHDLFGLDSGDADIDGGSGRDRVGYDGGGDLVVDGALGQWSDGVFSGTLTGVETASGDSGGDILTAGLDLWRLFGNEGADTLTGSAGDDVLEGGDGDDVLEGGLGDDVIKGGRGLDTLSFTGLGAAGVTISLVAGGAQNTGVGGLDRISGVENLVGTSGGDSFTGDGQDNDLDGADGDDVLSGGDGADTLAGGLGADQLVGGRGVDVLDGGDGADTFIWYSLEDGRAGRGADVVVYLHAADVIDVSSIDADSGTDGDQAFTHVGLRLTGEAGQLSVRYNLNTDMTAFRFDVDGDGQADMVIRVEGDVGGYNNFAL